MATIKTIKRRNGVSHQIGFTMNGRRRWLSLGSVYTSDEAREIAAKVETIAAAITAGRPLDRRVERWLDAIPDDLRDRMEKCELVETTREPTLGDIWDAYVENEYYDLKQTTQSNKRSAARRFFDFFDRETTAASVTKRDAVAFVAFLDRSVKEATRAGTIRDVRRVFNWAIENEIVASNPFNGVKRGTFKNKTREYFVSREDYRLLLDAAPSQLWRAVLALYRIGGLRCSEALLLQWADVDFPRGRMLVHSPKTERHRGRESRVVPLFPELRVELEKLWDETPEGGPSNVVPSNRTTIAKHIERIVFFAGLNRWERLVQNLRSSRAIEVEREFGPLAEAEWIGHSPQTARDHYLHVLDDDFERAARGDGRTAWASERDHANDHSSGCNSTQFDATGRNSTQNEKSA